MRGGKRCDFGPVRIGYSNDCLFGCGLPNHVAGAGATVSYEAGSGFGG